MQTKRFWSTSGQPRKKVSSIYQLPRVCDKLCVEYEAARAHVQEVLGLSADAIPKFSRSEAAVSSTAKRKAADGDGDVQMSDGAGNSSDAQALAQARLHAEAAAAYIPFLTADNLLPPKLPSREEMEGVLLDLRKKALVEEYFGENNL